MRKTDKVAIEQLCIQKCFDDLLPFCFCEFHVQTMFVAVYATLCSTGIHLRLRDVFVVVVLILSSLFRTTPSNQSQNANAVKYAHVFNRSSINGNEFNAMRIDLLVNGFCTLELTFVSKNNTHTHTQTLFQTKNCDFFVAVVIRVHSTGCDKINLVQFSSICA